MVQIRKGTTTTSTTGTVGILLGNNTTTTGTSSSTSTYSNSRICIVLLKLVLLCIIVGQLLFLSYTILVITTTTMIHWMHSNNNNNNHIHHHHHQIHHTNVRHVSRNDIIVTTNNDPETSPTDDDHENERLGNDNNDHDNNNSNSNHPNSVVAVAVGVKNNNNNNDHHHPTTSTTTTTTTTTTTNNDHDNDPTNSVLFKRFGTGPARDGYVVDLLLMRSIRQPPQQQSYPGSNSHSSRSQNIQQQQQIQTMHHNAMIVMNDYLNTTTTTTTAQPCIMTSSSNTVSTTNRQIPFLPRMSDHCINIELLLLSSSSSSTTTTTTKKTQLYGYNTVPFVRYYSTNPCHHYNDHHNDNHHGHHDTMIQILQPNMVIPIPTCRPITTTDSSSSSNTHHQQQETIPKCMTHVFPFDVSSSTSTSSNGGRTIIPPPPRSPPIIIYDRSTRTMNDLLVLATTSTITTTSTSTIDNNHPILPITTTTKIPWCDVPCEYETHLLPSTTTTTTTTDSTNPIMMMMKELGIVGTNWTMKQITSDPYYNTNAKIERTNYRNDIYYSTFSFQSSIPLSNYNPITYPLRHTKAIDFDTAKNAATYVLNTNCAYGNRHKWVAAVQVVLPVMAYGSCHNNAPLLPHETIETKEGRIQLMRQNRIVLAFEAGTDKDYITNIVWEALLSGSVPAILGASNLQLDHLPPHSAIFTSQFNSWDAFAAYVANVANNETLWNSYHTWRNDEMALRQFEERYAFLQSSPECRTCRWAYSKQYGMGFNHTTQQIQPTKIGRTLCITPKTNLMTQPFRESWYVANEHVPKLTRRDHSSDVPCSPTTSSTNIIHVYDGQQQTEGMGTIKYETQRSIVEQDGVIDMTIHSIMNHDPSGNGPLMVRFDMNDNNDQYKIRNTDGASFHNVHAMITEGIHTSSMSSIAIQDEYVKITIITNGIDILLRSPTEGMIDIEISNGKTMPSTTLSSILGLVRIRIIIEDINPIHDKLTEYFPSSYARRMMHDFIDPLELYYTTTTG